MIESLYMASQAMLLVAAAMIIAYTLRGPSAYDRVLGLDTLALLLAGFLILESRGANLRLFLDTALALVLLSFVGTILLARAIAKGEGRA